VDERGENRLADDFYKMLAGLVEHQPAEGGSAGAEGFSYEVGERRPARDEVHPALIGGEFFIVVAEDGLQNLALKKRDLAPGAYIFREKTNAFGVAVALDAFARDGEKLGPRFHGGCGLGREVERGDLSSPHLESPIGVVQL